MRTSTAPAFSPPDLRRGYDEEETQQKLEKFLAGVRKGKSRAKICRELGLHYGSVLRWLDPRQQAYKPDFWEKYEQARSEYLDDLEGMVAEGIELALEQQDAATVVRSAMAVLERLRKSEWSRQELRVMSGTVTHQHVHQLQSVRQEAVLQAAEVSRALLGGDVIDAELVGDATVGSLRPGLPTDEA